MIVSVQLINLKGPGAAIFQISTAGVIMIASYFTNNTT